MPTHPILARPVHYPCLAAGRDRLVDVGVLGTVASGSRRARSSRTNWRPSTSHRGEELLAERGVDVDHVRSTGGCRTSRSSSLTSPGQRGTRRGSVVRGRDLRQGRQPLNVPVPCGRSGRPDRRCPGLRTPGQHQERPAPGRAGERDHLQLCDQPVGRQARRHRGDAPPAQSRRADRDQRRRRRGPPHPAQRAERGRSRDDERRSSCSSPTRDRPTSDRSS